jgi:hypothetical protein
LKTNGEILSDSKIQVICPQVIRKGRHLPELGLPGDDYNGTRKVATTGEMSHSGAQKSSGLPFVCA